MWTDRSQMFFLRIPRRLPQSRRVHWRLTHSPLPSLCCSSTYYNYTKYIIYEHNIIHICAPCGDAFSFNIIASRSGWALRTRVGKADEWGQTPLKKRPITPKCEMIYYRVHRRCHRANGPHHSRATLPSVAPASGENRSGAADGVARVANVAHAPATTTLNRRQHLRWWWWWEWWW